MRASFVIVNYNRKDELLLTLAKTKELIADNSAVFEILVVDNASTDGSAAAVRVHFPDVDLIVNPVNTGAPAWNMGFEKASGEYFIILDDDSHIVSGLEEGLAYMDTHPAVGVLALNVVSGPYTKANWKWKDGDETIGFIGCGAILRKETYDKVGGYADWMFLYVNEWEYGLRCLNAGYSVKFFENSIVEHRASKIHRTSKRLRVFVSKHELGIVYKFFSKNRTKYLITVAINHLKSIRKGQFNIAWYNLLGLVAFLKMRKTLSYTPVSPEAQDKFAKIFLATQPVFGFLKKIPSVFKRS
ncbi:MAG: glycosyltransferase [Bacteroidota bacterium]|nr:glycosyltransferase [Bacteroidota bacterium]